MTDKRNEKNIRRLMQTGMDGDSRPSRARSAVSRARRQVGQQDTLAFALVRIWAVLARLLAPLFAFFGEKQARAIYQNTSGPAARAGDETKNNDSD
ncbi:MAG: hypothetical protein QNJ14_00570 [Woeseiaceae bacterium]|nr:hypothetical protein [Woeseiaceae bacterium]